MLRDYPDTINSDFRMLKAHINNDSAFFSEFNYRMDQDAKALKEYLPLDSCVLLKKLSALNVDEAYRFSHSQSFCDFSQKITITKSRDEVRLRFVEYSNGNGRTSEFLTVHGDTIKVKPYCTVVKEFEKPLSIKDWEELGRLLYNADYWGLKSRQFSQSTDGSSWRIDAFTKRPKEPEGQQVHFVSRHCSCNPAYEELGNYFLKLSGEKTMCGDFF